MVSERAEGRGLHYPDRLELEEIRARITLLEATGVGPVKIRALIEHFGCATDVIKASDDSLLSIKGIGGDIVRALRSAYPPNQGDKSVEAALQRGCRLLSITDPDFPQLLAAIYTPPALLWIDGRHRDYRGPSVAIVGTRRPSESGKSTAYALAYSIASQGITIVSGMAHGIDAVAHEAALDVGGITIAVQGSGLNHIYPRFHRRLAERIKNQGCLMSEFPLDMPAHPGHFPRRNRIISGLAEATIVVEAYEKGGALLTARLALDQNREVYAVPGVIGNPAAEGTNQLIQRGEAQLLTSAADVIKGLVQNEEAMQSPPEFVSETDRKIMSALSIEPRHIDELAEDLTQCTSELLIHLLQLECGGKVRQLPGKYFVLSPMF